MRRSAALIADGTSSEAQRTDICARIPTAMLAAITRKETIGAMTMSEKIEKPPLGCKPAFIVAEDRILDLCSGIGRMIDGGNYEMAKKFAKEIYLQCDLLLQMESEE